MIGKYFKRKAFVQHGAENSKYDVTINPDLWEEMVRDGANANIHYNSSLSNLVNVLSYEERKRFIEK